MGIDELRSKSDKLGPTFEYDSSNLRWVFCKTMADPKSGPRLTEAAAVPSLEMARGFIRGYEEGKKS